MTRKLFWHSDRVSNTEYERLGGLGCSHIKASVAYYILQIKSM